MSHQIEDFVAIDRKSPTPLYVQVRDGLRHWLEQVEARHHLPAERRLAKLLGVDRTTIKKAYNAYVREGVLKRNIKGTFVVRKPGDGNDHIHPFALPAETVPASRPTLQIAIFENWPAQKMVWERIVAAFNRSYRGASLEIKWLPFEVRTLDTYKAYIRENRPDVVLLSHQMAMQMKEGDLLAPLPDDLARELRQESYYGDMAGADESGLLAYSMPVHLNCWGVVWNEDLVGDGPPPPPHHAGLIQWLVTVGKRLPRRVNLLASTGSLSGTRGVPVLASNEDVLRKHIEDSFEAILPLRPVSSRCLWETMPAQFRKPFMSGQTACFAGNLGLMLNFLPTATFRVNGLFLKPDDGCLFPVQCSCVAIPREGRHPQHAAAVLRHLASQAAQDEITAAPIDAAFRRDSNRNLLAFLRAGNAAIMEESLSRQYMLDARGYFWSWALFYGISDLFHDVLEARRTIPEAVALALERARPAYNATRSIAGSQKMAESGIPVRRFFKNADRISAPRAESGTSLSTAHGKENGG